MEKKIPILGLSYMFEPYSGFKLERLQLAVLVLALTLAACQTSPSVPPTPSATMTTPIASSTIRNLANNCFTCHGAEARSPGEIPSLALSVADLAARLRGFKSGEIASTVMGRLAKGYSEAEIDAVADYIGGLKKHGSP